MSLSCTDHLIQEHRLILRAVYIVKVMADQAKQLKMPDSADVEALLAFFQRFADEHHQTKEETILFPSLRTASSGKTNNSTHQLAFEHEQERLLTQALLDALRTRKHEDFAYFGNRLAEVLGNHIYKEDHILSELANATIPAEMDATLVREMTEFDRSLQPGLYNEWILSIKRLEGTYLNKVA